MDASPEIIGQYRVIKAIGRGAMGVVYRVAPPGGAAEVALKVMAGEMANDEELVERFRREALSASELDHPNITRVLDFGEDGDQIYMAMELLDGEDLKGLIERGAAGSLARRLSIMEQAAAGMAFVHARHLVHRDLKPGNLHVMSDGRVKVMDFGLVRLGDSNMTRTGMAMGTPSYMSPEVIRGEKADARSDVFSLGACFYELLTGQRAFRGKGVAQILMDIMGREPDPIASVAPEVPAPVARIVERCLRKQPAERYQGCGEMHAAIEVVRHVYVG